MPALDVSSARGPVSLPTDEQHTGALFNAWADALVRFDDAVAVHNACQEQLRAAHDAVEQARNVVLRTRSELEHALRVQRRGEFDPEVTEAIPATSRSP